MAKRAKTWEDIGNVKARQAGRRRQLEIDANWRAKNRSPSTAVVTDTDTLSTIAQANGTTEDDLLDANPDLKYLKTGMVVNVPGSKFSLKNTDPLKSPVPGSPEWRAQNVGGLPSNSPLGSTQGYQGAQVNMWQGVTPGYNTQLAPNTNSLSTNLTGSLTSLTNPFANPTGTGLNPFSRYEYKPPQAGLFGASPQPANTTPNQPVRQRSFAPRGNFGTFIDSITQAVGPGGRLPTEFELQYLIDHGRVKPATTPAYASGGGGGYGKKKGGGGGRSGGGASAPRAPSEPRLPAFSSGAGFSGLVNWRI